MNGAGRKLDAVFLSANVGRKLDLVATALELLRQGRGGKEMPARAACGEQDRAPAHAACSLTGAASASDRASAPRLRRPAIGRLRVSPSKKPMVSAMASSEEPP